MDAVLEQVWMFLVMFAGRANFLFDHLTPVTGEVVPGASLKLPRQARPTRASTTVRAAPQSLLPTIDTLNVNDEAFYNVALPRLATPQLLRGNWADQTAMHGGLHMRSDIDDDCVKHFLGVHNDLAYHVNIDGDPLDPTHTAIASAGAASGDGRLRSNIEWFASPFFGASAQSIGAWQPHYAAAENGALGIPQIAFLNGLPVFESNSVPGFGNQLSFAVTASAIAGGVLTMTLDLTNPSGGDDYDNPFVVGQLVYSEGLQVDEGDATTPAVVTAVGADTVSVATTAGDDADNETGTIYAATSMAIVFDKSLFFKAIQEEIDVEQVKDYEGPDSALQFYAAYGKEAIAGCGRILHAPLIPSAP